MRIEGHTDSKGNDVYNQKISEQRAASVKSWLIDNKAYAHCPVQYAGIGEKKPVASNTKPDGSDDPDGRQKNRRVEIVIRKS